MSQWIWLVIFIFALYYKLVTDLIPRISNSFKARAAEAAGEATQATTAASSSADLNLNITVPTTTAKSVSAYTPIFSKSFTSW